MSRAKNSIRGLVEDAIRDGAPLTGRAIRGLREQNVRAVRAYKAGFWVGIALFNLLIWVPLPISGGMVILLAVLTLAIALAVPILGIRKHQANLGLLEESPSEPQRSRADGPGKAYIEQVRQEGRNFIKAEMEALMGGSKSSAV